MIYEEGKTLCMLSKPSEKHWGRKLHSGSFNLNYNTLLLPPVLCKYETSLYDKGWYNLILDKLTDLFSPASAVPMSC